MACAEFIGSQVGQGWQLVDAVVVHRLGRLSRNSSDFQQIMAELNAHNVPVVPVTQQIDMSNHMGRVATNTITYFTEFKRGSHREHSAIQRVFDTESPRLRIAKSPQALATQDL